MATILRGKHKGQEVKIHQRSNDWIMVEGLPNQESVFSPGSLRLTPQEAMEVLLRPNGIFNYFEIDAATGTFRRRRRT